MRSLVVSCSILLILLSLLLAGTASSQVMNSYHGSELLCSDCHTIHYSQHHDYSGNPTGGDNLPANADTGGPFENLLIKANTTELCLVCHDSQPGTPDVLGADANGLNERSAGFFGDVGDLNPTGHNLRQDSLPFYPDVMGDPSVCSDCHPNYFGYGSGPANATLGCLNCHDPHGRDRDDVDYRYRNLRWAEYPGLEPVIKAHVNPSPGAPINVYERANIGYAAPAVQNPVPKWREVTNICMGCHHGFIGNYNTRLEDNGVLDDCGRHPITYSESGVWEPINGRADVTEVNTDPANWVLVSGGAGFTAETPRLPFLVKGATDYEGATTVAADNEVFCLTCHKAHGSGNSFGLTWDYASNMDGCQQCHNK